MIIQINQTPQKKVFHVDDISKNGRRIIKNLSNIFVDVFEHICGYIHTFHDFGTLVF